MAVPHEEPVFRRQGLVEPEVDLVPVGCPRRVVREVPACVVREVGVRVKAGQPSENGVEAAARNRGVRERLAGGVLELAEAGGLAEVSRALERGGNDDDVGLRLAQLPSLPASEEERLVFHDRSAERRSVLVLAQDLRVCAAVPVAVAPREGLACVEVVVAHEFVGAAPEVVRPAADRYVDDRAGVAPVLRRVVAGLNLELLDRVHRGDDGLRLAILLAHDRRVVVDAIDQEIVLADRLAVADEAAAEAGVTERPPVAAPNLGCDAGGEQRQRLVVASADRQVFDLLALDGVVERGRFGLQQRRGPGDLHDLDHISHLEREVNAEPIAGMNLDSRPHGLLETFGLYRNLVDPDPERACDVGAAGIGLPFARDVGVDFADGDRSAGYHGPGRIGDRAGNDTLVRLSPCQGCRDECCSQRPGQSNHESSLGRAMPRPTAAGQFCIIAATPPALAALSLRQTRHRRVVSHKAVLIPPKVAASKPPVESMACGAFSCNCA